MGPRGNIRTYQKITNTKEEERGGGSGERRGGE
jgi:hypothetical protein